jgi:hypothetical protein
VDDGRRKVMKIRLRRLPLFLLGFLGLTATAAPVDPIQNAGSERSKETLGFSGWPGKKGSLKPGVPFDPANVTSLSGFTVDRDTRRLDSRASRTVLRSLVLRRGREEVRVDLQVGMTSTDELQEAMLHHIMLTNAPLDWLYVRGDQNGIAVGDLNFVYRDYATNLSFIHFVRNNVRVHLARSEGSTADLKALAQEIDAKIKGGKDFAPDTLGALVPKITTFTPQAATLPTFSSMPVTLTASDPGGLKFEVQLKADAGQLTRDAGVAPSAVLFRSNNWKGKAILTVTVINENLLFASASTTVTIE